MNGALGSFVCNLSAVLGSAVGTPPADAAEATDGLVTDGGDNLVTDTGDRLVFG